LPVLACSELVMADDPDRNRVGSLGDVLRGKGDLDKVERTAYEEVAEHPGLSALIGSPALVFKMINPNLKIHQVKHKGGATRYWEENDVGKDQDYTDLGPAQNLNTGQPVYEAGLAWDLRLCSAKRSDPA